MFSSGGRGEWGAWAWGGVGEWVAGGSGEHMLGGEWVAGRSGSMCMGGSGWQGVVQICNIKRLANSMSL